MARRTKSTKSAPKPKKPPRPKPPPKPRKVSWHEQKYTALATHVEKSAYAPAREVSPTTGLLELSGTEGLADVLLELAGEGQLSIGHALSAWQREQDRIANRAWRRPGGLARMGGL